MQKIAVKLSGVSKKYTLHHEKPTLVENIFGKGENEEFWALRNINLTIYKGERVGIIGPNGSGKTTLLKIVTGITTPTSGKVFVKGKVVSIIELESGFHSELTGEENIYLNGLLLGMSKYEVRSKLKDIISFTDIGRFIDAPLYVYSTGMKLRLGFSIAIHSDPDILILDENIETGDQDFKIKSLRKIQQFVKGKKTIVLASHSMVAVSSITRRVVWIDKAKLVKDGPVKSVIRDYEKAYTSV